MKHVRRICAVLLAAVVLLPVVLLCVQAFVPPFDALMISTGSEPLRLLPIPFSAEQWQMLFNQSTYWQAFWNSLIWTVGACAVQVMVAFLGGYVLAKYPARWCVALAGLYTLMMLMPPQMTCCPSTASPMRTRCSITRCCCMRRLRSRRSERSLCGNGCCAGRTS